MRQVVCHVVLVLCIISGMSYSTSEKGKLIRVDLSGKDETVIYELLRLHPDIAYYNPKDRSIEIVVHEREDEAIAQLGFEVFVQIEDLDARAKEMRQINYFEPFHTYAEMLEEMHSVEDAYPDIAKLFDIGDSWEKTQGLADRDIWAIKISDNVSQEELNEPEVLYDAGHHAREIITPEVLIYFMHYLVDNYGSDPEVTSLVDNRQLWLVPMVNPDGHEYVFEIDPWWRKNRRDNGDGTYGVDPNRNYSYMWGYDDIGSSPNPNSQTYRGTGPFSEPETQAIRDLTEAHNFFISLSYHSSGNILIIPWGYIEANTPDHEIFWRITQGMTAFNGYEPGNPASGVIYVTNGSSNDWMYGEQAAKKKVFGITPEVGMRSYDGFHPKHSRIEPLILENLGPNLFVAEIAGSMEFDIPPTMEPIIEPENEWYRLPPTFSNFGFDDDTGLNDGWYQTNSYAGAWTLLFENLSGMEWNSNGWTLQSFENLPEGNNTIYFKVSDDSGHAVGKWGELNWEFRKDTTPPSGPTQLTSLYHTTGEWSRINGVTVAWTAAIDTGSGWRGYSYEWDTVSITVPDTEIDITLWYIDKIVSPPLADGNDHYYHISAVDQVGNWGKPVHLGPFFIDTSPPTNGTILVNGGADTTHSKIVTLNSLDAVDNLSGLDSMSFSNDDRHWSPIEPYAMDRSNWDLTDYGGIDESGMKTVYVMYKDVAGNWSEPFSDTIIYSAPLIILTTKLSIGILGTSYSESLSAGGGWPPYMWSVISGDLPEGLSLDSTGVIGGIPVAVETGIFTVEVRDAVNNENMKELLLVIIPQLRGDVDGNGQINVLDVLATVNHILGIQILEGSDLWAADCNGEENINILDVVGIVNVILGIGTCEP